MEKLSSCPVCGSEKSDHFLKSVDFFLSKEDYNIVSCNHCGFKFVNPRPDAGEIGKYYESIEYVSHDAGKRNWLNFLYKRARKFSIKNKFTLVKRESTGVELMDIGCGTGEFIHYCKEKGFKVIGIEPGEKPRTLAINEYNLEVYDEAHLNNFINPEFDIITLWHVLEHVHLLNDLMKKIVEILKPDGTLIIAVPNSDSWDASYYGKYWAAYDLPRHLYHFSQETMQILLRNHSLKIKQVIPMKLDAFYISLLSEKYLRGKLNYFRAIINGIRSNNFARRSKNNFSSLIFVIKKEKTEF
jgi:2-polyprenyl-3-methyl-5-hydroxy-6-metoxy-1,4-benzoquinol methylase